MSFKEHFRILGKEIIDYVTHTFLLVLVVCILDALASMLR